MHFLSLHKIYSCIYISYMFFLEVLNFGEAQGWNIFFFHFIFVAFILNHIIFEHIYRNQTQF